MLPDREAASKLAGDTYDIPLAVRQRFGTIYRKLEMHMTAPTICCS